MYRLSMYVRTYTQMCKYLHFEVSIYVNTYTVKTMMSNIIEIQYFFLGVFARVYRRIHIYVCKYRYVLMWSGVHIASQPRLFKVSILKMVHSYKMTLSHIHTYHSTFFVFHHIMNVHYTCILCFKKHAGGINTQVHTDICAYVLICVCILWYSLREFCSLYFFIFERNSSRLTVTANGTS